MSKCAFQVYQDNDTELRWMVFGPSGKSILDSCGGFETIAETEAEVLAVADLIGRSLATMRFETFLDMDARHAFRMADSKGNALCVSMQSYDSESDAQAGIVETRELLSLGFEPTIRRSVGPHAR